MTTTTNKERDNRSCCSLLLHFKSTTVPVVGLCDTESTTSSGICTVKVTTEIHSKLTSGLRGSCGGGCSGGRRGCCRRGRRVEIVVVLESTVHSI